MASSAQEFLEFEEVREGTIVLKNRSIRGLMLVSSTNFALKSQEEQDAIVYQFQNFLNSLDFFIQITIQSRRLNITGYIDRLKSLEEEQTNELLKQQTESYRKFVETLIAGGVDFGEKLFCGGSFYSSGSDSGSEPNSGGNDFQISAKARGKTNRRRV